MLRKAFSELIVGGASLDVIKQYIENQRKPPSEKQINQSKKISAKSRLHGRPAPERNRIAQAFCSI